MNKSGKNSLPVEFKTIEEAIHFWDRHDLSDYWNRTQRTRFSVHLRSTKNYVALEKDIIHKAERIAHEKGISLETLLNLWVKDKLHHLQAA